MIVILSLASCKTREKIVYFQDVVPSETIENSPMKTLTLGPGDKLSVMVTSVKTPIMAQRYNLVSGNNSSSGQDYDKTRYTVDENGNIDLLGVGRIHVGGLTRSEAAEKMQEAYRKGILNDAVVTVAVFNQYITVLGDVAHPGRIEVKSDNITLLDAIGMAGDLNITACRDAIKVIRQEEGGCKTYFVDLRSKDIFKSPVYNLQQNDIVYVEPNKVKMGQSTNNDNALRTVSTWLSICSFLTTIAVVIFN